MSINLDRDECPVRTFSESIVLMFFERFSSEISERWRDITILSFIVL